MMPAAFAATITAGALALYARERRTARRLRAQLSAARIAAAESQQRADWLCQLLDRRGAYRADQCHETPAGPRLARRHEPPRHG